MEVGGLVGTSNNGTVTSCYARGAVSGNNLVGGLIGRIQYDTVTSCYATGAVSGNSDVGGLIGNIANGTVTSCYATGAVSGNNDVGGLVGYIYNSTVSSCYWDMETSSQSISSGGDGRITTEMTYPYAANTYVGWDFTTVWAADTDSSVNSGYPYLRKQAFLPEGEEEGETPSEGEMPGEGETPGEGEATPVQTPVVQGMTEDQARAQLTAAGFVVQVRYESSDSVPEGQVIRQEPEGGVLLAPGGTVTLVISSDDASEGGCCQNSKGLMTPVALIRRLLGDWLLIGVSMGALILVTRRR
ncbi:MAG: The GLUG motif protein [Candidatus Hydrogenedentes bacterium ADurb.Bin179]|nr:MAG: The GLUG motif protein [Candidatus Hydrogenedentes bacterium ADurb.Bin179]